ncbi:hypothetical protein MTQ10_11895 [Streptomyces sp. XM83C]|jgi:hypothetical protein|uniref:hypothetical protein n=1 Tax=Streptomyces sp. XM83C TaxID=2929781 RepID=UPI001FFB8CE9|nr:hypothetical protein [Streptomyces sp. XM83C]MCK1820302.1 hypothetical protein [Streptomyces sp. XM83C]
MAIRAEDDAEWALGLEEARPRPVQLIVGGMYGDRSADARPLRRRTKNGLKVGQGWWIKLRKQRAAPAGPPVLQAQMCGQLALFTVPRALTDATVSAIVGRPVVGWGECRPVIEAMAAEHGMSVGWQHKIAEMVRLALAVREAEGAVRLPEPMLRDLPSNGDAVRLVLLRAGLLDPAPEPMRFSTTNQPTTTYITAPAPLPPSVARSCRDCDAWMAAGKRGLRCDPCRHWRELHPAGRCVRCRRDELPLRGDRCRTCRLYRHLDDSALTAVRATQLVIDLPRGVPGQAQLIPVAEPAPAEGEDEAVSALHAARGQKPLFGMRRNWSPVMARLRRRSYRDLPLTSEARALTEELDRLRRGRQDPAYRKDIRTLTILVYWLGAETPFQERDVHDLALLDPNLAAKRVCQFLAARGLLVEDPELHRDADQVWVEATIATLPPTVADEVSLWVTVLRGQGRREHEARSYDGIRRYLTSLQPVLTAWTRSGITTLRQITSDHATTAVDELTGSARRQLAISLRNLFKALRQERVIFRDPTRNLPVGDLKGIPKSVPSDLLATLLDRATTPLGRLIVALTAVHALPGHEMPTLLTCDLNLAHGTLEARRGLLRHTLYIEEFTHGLAAEWLTYRHRRWPASTNPHLLVSQRTALDPDHPPVSMTMLHRHLPKGFTLDGLRQDRILNEAFETGDPLKLMRLFGITEKTAMHYVGVAHPEKTSQLPR